MNLLLLDASEVSSAGEVHLTGRRAEHLRTILGVQVGQQLRAGLVGGELGQVIVTEVGTGGVGVVFSGGKAPPPVPAVDLVLALPRPQTLKKVLQSAAALGVGSITLFRSAKVEKSFFSSPLLLPAALQAELLLGLEQAGDTRLPRVHIVPRFRPLVEELLPQQMRDAGMGLVGHPRVEEDLWSVGLTQHGGRVVVVVGPEGGFTEFELGALTEVGCRPFSLGDRILRVETAVVVTLAQIQLLRGRDRHDPQPSGHHSP